MAVFCSRVNETELAPFNASASSGARWENRFLGRQQTVYFDFRRSFIDFPAVTVNSEIIRVRIGDFRIRGRAQMTATTSDTGRIE